MQEKKKKKKRGRGGDGWIERFFIFQRGELRTAEEQREVDGC